MAQARRPLVAGNWKMNGLTASAGEFDGILRGAAEIAPQVDLLVCPPATLLASFSARAAGSPVRTGGQDCHTEASGAFTGDLSAEMLADAGASFVIVGHSERRTLHGETSELVARKAAAAVRAGLTAIVCVGETEAQRRAGETLGIIATQIRESIPDGMTAAVLVVAYEPVWAIGTGLTPTTGDIAEVHGAMRRHLEDRFSDGHAVRLLYGGSVKPGNASELMAVPDVDGALVGGASLKAADFLGIAAACR